ncbi:flavin reductase family protein [Beijerinckia sp. L45]|uniref:flavin reductase family protein n=1 Tax=Beijerinckia sp. L45 TaxID=1641855 RepID=UPI00131DAC5B|nr:flavin reductase family protein [Beijerinckia sp. L45]
MLFYEPQARDKTVLPHDPFKALIAPRPIGWVTTIGLNGAINLAPYSFFNAFADSPPIIAFSSQGIKDSVTFAQETGQFVWNMPTWDLREAMNQTAAPLPRGQSEAAFAHLEMAPSQLVKPPRVKASPAALECEVIEVKKLVDRHGTPTGHWLVFGEVVGVHLDETFIKDGLVDMAAMQPIARCGYMDYVVADTVFQMKRPPRVRADGTLEG